MDLMYLKSVAFQFYYYFLQKTLLFKKKFLHEDENNAFIRISTSLNDSSPAIARTHVSEFIDEFYPKLKLYINSK